MSIEEIEEVGFPFWEKKGYSNLYVIKVDSYYELYGTKLMPSRYWRARLNLIQQTLPMLDDKERRLYSNGFIPTKHIKSFDKQTQNLSKEQSNEPLSFAELTSYSTWFAMHPEKIAGQETEASSIQFPIKLKGNKKDIEKMFASVFGDKVSDESEAEAEALAIALMLELELMDM